MVGRDVVVLDDRGIVLAEPILRRLLESTGVGANLTTDAHIAALAFEHGFTVASNDADFARFEGVRLTNPLAGRRSARS